jgi:hypothetical protein
MKFLTASVLYYYGAFAAPPDPLVDEIVQAVPKPSCTSHPSIFVSVLARDVEHSAHQFLHALASQSYPKECISIFVATDSNSDGTAGVFRDWAAEQEKGGEPYFHASVHSLGMPETKSELTEGWKTSRQCDHKPHCWETPMLKHVGRLRGATLAASTKLGYDRYVPLDADVYLVGRETLGHLVSLSTPKVRKAVVSPRLLAWPNTWDVNIWYAHDRNGFYDSHPNRAVIGSMTGAVRIRSAHSMMMIDLHHPKVDRITWLHERVSDDVAAFSLALTAANIPIFGVQREEGVFGIHHSVAGDNSEHTHLEEIAVSRVIQEACKAISSAEGDLQKAIARPPQGSAATVLRKLAEAQASDEVLEEVLKEKNEVGLRERVDELADTISSLETILSDLRNGYNESFPQENLPDVNTWLQVDRRSNLSLKDFSTQYASKGLPVIITDYIQQGRMSVHDVKHTETCEANAEAAHYVDDKNETRFKWGTLEYFRQLSNCGDKHFNIQKRVPKSIAWAGLEGMGGVKMDDYARLLDDDAKGKQPEDPKQATWLKAPSVGVFDTPLRKTCGHVLDEFIVPKYFANDILQHMDGEGSGLTYVGAWPSLFVGSPIVGGGGLHTDTFGSSFWMALMSGRKHWRFIDQKQRHLLYEERAGNKFETDLFEEFDLDKYPMLRFLTNKYEAVMKAGDLLYVPAGSPHQVRQGPNALAGVYIAC